MRLNELKYEVESAVDSLQSSMISYAKLVNKDRAIIDARDGLKPVQRRILYTLYEEGLFSDKKHKKLATMVGKVMAYHPHGDSAISSAAYVLSRDWFYGLPLLDIQGNKGSILASDMEAASRYTEVRLSNYGDLLVNGLNYDSIDYRLNYDSTLKEPIYLPASYPVALSVSNMGIGYRMSSHVVSHNVLELLEACKLIAKKGNVSTKELLKVIKGPDFQTKGIVIDKENKSLIEEIETGKTKYVTRGKLRKVVDKKESYIEIYEMPPEVYINDLVESIVKALIPLQTPLCVKDVKDLSSLKTNDIKIRIECQKGTPMNILDKIENVLITKTLFENKISVENNMVINQKPKLLGIREYLEFFVNFRRETLIRIWNHKLLKVEDKLEILYGLVKLREIIDKVIEIAKSSSGKKDMVDKLIKKFKFSTRQAEHISEIPLYRLGRNDEEYNLKIDTDLQNNENERDEFRKRLQDKEYQTKCLIQDFSDTMKLFKHCTRKTEILLEDDVKVVSLKEEEIVEKKLMRVVIKQNLQVFKIGTSAYQNQIEKYTDTDIAHSFEAYTTDYISIITKTGKTITRFVNDLEQANLNGKVTPLNTVVKDILSTDELIYGVIGNEDKTVLLTKYGYGKAVKNKDLILNTSNKGYIKRSGKITGFKVDGDSILFIKDFNKVGKEKLNISILNNKKFKTMNKSIILKDIYNREDTPTNSGYRFVNTKDKELEIISVEEV